MTGVERRGESAPSLVSPRKRFSVDLSLARMSKRSEPLSLVRI